MERRVAGAAERSGLEKNKGKIVISSQSTLKGTAKGMSKGAGKGEGQGHAPAPPCMPPALNCACVPYNDAWLPHRLSEYGNCVCSFCHAKHWVEEKQQGSSINNPMFTLCCNAGKVCSI